MKAQKLALGVFFILGLGAALYLPMSQAADSLVSRTLPIVLFGLIAIDWVWLRLIRPDKES